MEKNKATNQAQSQLPKASEDVPETKTSAISKIRYIKIGEFYYSNIVMPEYPPLRKYGMMLKKYLLDYRPLQVDIMMTEGTFTPHLLSVQNRADEMHEIVMKRKVKAAEKRGELTPNLRSEDPMLWARIMTRLDMETTSEVSQELIYIYDKPLRMEWD